MSFIVVLGVSSSVWSVVEVTVVVDDGDDEEDTGISEFIELWVWKLLSMIGALCWSVGAISKKMTNLNYLDNKHLENYNAHNMPASISVSVSLPRSYVSFWLVVWWLPISPSSATIPGFSERG